MNDATTNSSARHGRILVIGGTGVIGAPIVAQLQQAGWQVRVMSRHAEQAREQLGEQVELVSASADDGDAVAGALASCHAALISVGDLLDPYLELRVTRHVLAAAPAAGVQRVGLISGASVAAERRSNPGIDSKYQAEEALKQSGLPWVIFRPSWPMESLLRFVRDGTASVFGKQPSTIHPLAGADLGRMVARAFELDKAAGHTFTLQGPEAFTMKQWLEAYCALAEPQAQVKNVPLWVMSAVAFLSRDRTLKAVVELMRYFEDLPACGDPDEADRILGPAQITQQQWTQLRHAA